jgi:D-arabinose 1-dehydrogenase-like Zn-dependent alcohol dehydrogenase
VIVSPEGKFHEEAIQRSESGIDLALELTGSATFASALRSLRRGGRMVVVGNIETAKVQINPGALILYGHSILGSGSCTPQDVLDVVKLVEQGELTARIDRILPLAEAATAHQLLADRAVVGRVVLVP